MIAMQQSLVLELQGLPCSIIAKQISSMSSVHFPSSGLRAVPGSQPPSGGGEAAEEQEGGGEGLRRRAGGGRRCHGGGAVEGEVEEEDEQEGAEKGQEGEQVGQGGGAALVVPLPRGASLPGKWVELRPALR